MAKANDGYVLSRTYYNTSGSSQEVEFDGSFTMPARDVTIYAVFEPAATTYTITRAKSEDNSFPCVDSAKAGDSVKVTPYMKEGTCGVYVYYIEATSLEPMPIYFGEYTDEGYDELTFAMPEDDVTLYIEV